MLCEFYLYPPTAEGLQTLQSYLNTRSRGFAGDTDPLLDELAIILNAMSDLGQFADDLGIEYTYLFHGLKKDSGLAPPYESVHRESRLIGEMTKSVINAYADAGYQDIYESAGPQDHLGVELRFLSLLCFDESQFWFTNDTDSALLSRARQSDFIDQHVMEWMPAYCKALEHESAARYYQIIAKLTSQALERDKQALGELRSEFGQN